MRDCQGNGKTQSGILIWLYVMLSSLISHLADCSLVFPDRDGTDFKAKSFLYRNLDAKARESFFQEHAVRYAELCRLSYFDPVRMSIIDPMHNILLGK